MIFNNLLEKMMYNFSMVKFCQQNACFSLWLVRLYLSVKIEMCKVTSGTGKRQSVISERHILTL